jgi:SAM-dependent methyltransferase
LEEEKCCVVSCENPLNQEYWDTQYKVKATGWDIGSVSGPIKTIVDALENKNSSILIPGCGNSYEAEYLLKQGFTNVTVIDIAPTLVAAISEKFADNENIKVVLGDFFELEGKYDLIIEQTFFCALPPTMRQKYVWKMHQLLAENGKIEGVLFNRDFDVSPPFGGNKAEYEQLFVAAFDLVKLELCQNSIEKRTNTELVIDFQKNTKVLVNLYAFEGITCSGCMSTVSNKFMEIEGVENVSMSSNFAEVLIVSTKEIPLNLLQEIVSYDEKYKITKII